MEFKEEKLSIKNLKQGLVYVVKDGRLLLYCGKANTEEYLFYLVGSVNLVSGVNWGTRAIYNFEFMHPYILDSVTKMMNSLINVKGVLLYRTIPFCIGVYPNLDFSSSLMTWLAKNKLCVKDFGSAVNFTENKKPQYVKAKDLVEGKVYTTASSYAEDYVYLGKDRDNNYCWVFIGNHDWFSKNPYSYLNGYIQLDRTKTMKKLKGVSKMYLDFKLDMHQVRGII